jgi:prolipoprotein diacylglyceryltransferase
MGQWLCIPMVLGGIALYIGSGQHKNERKK